MSERDSDALVVSKTRRTLEGKRSESHYACGPIRATVEEAMQDARVFARLPELIASIKGIADPDADRWHGETVLRMFRRLLGIDETEKKEG